ncbi:MAG TPA: HAD-IIIA family hydrolase [Ignavibacteriaceae bacterium]|nr:HAD-IIIA family hydrolase [Ignavibacteriaceae bacterium]
MVIASELKENNLHLTDKAKKIKLILTDNDGVLTDTGVFYSDQGEVMKRFSIRDGMGVERLRNLLKIETGIITGELSGSVKKRAEKLQIKELYLGAKNKASLLNEILNKNNLQAENIAYIGDDVNDIELMKLVGLTASPSDGIPDIRNIVDYVCKEKGGYGAFREFAELIIALGSD